MEDFIDNETSVSMLKLELDFWKAESERKDKIITDRNATIERILDKWEESSKRWMENKK